MEPTGQYRVNVWSHISGRFYVSRFVTYGDALKFFNNADSEARMYQRIDGKWLQIAHHK